jgi:transcriptional regulator NrdR
LRCPFCAHDDSQVKDSRPTEDNTSIRRRRQCESCGGRFTTFERVQLREVIVVKSGANGEQGRREPFDRGKLEQSVTLACRKRGIAQERLDQLVSGIQRQVETSGEGEVPVLAHRRDGDGRPAPARFGGLHPVCLGLPGFFGGAGLRGVREQRARCRRDLTPR